MSYTPLWTQRADHMRRVLAELDPEHPKTEVDAAIYRLGAWAAAWLSDHRYGGEDR